MNTITFPFILPSGKEVYKVRDENVYSIYGAGGDYFIAALTKDDILSLSLLVGSISLSEENNG